MTMANAKSTTKRPPPPYSPERRYQATIALLREKILPSSDDLLAFSGTSIAEDKELFSLDYLRSCARLPLPPTPSAPPARLIKVKPCPIREITVGSLPRVSRAWSHAILPAVPFVRLAGRWFAEAGFQIGDLVSVKVDSGRLVIEPVTKDSIGQ
jgi:Toxin SymE, type I toxin-antitoxin system